MGHLELSFTLYLYLPALNIQVGVDFGEQGHSESNKFTYKSVVFYLLPLPDGHVTETQEHSRNLPF